MIRATARSVPPGPGPRGARSGRAAAAVPTLLVAASLLLGGVVTAPGAAASSTADVDVSTDGVAFRPGYRSDEVAYVVLPVGSRHGGQAYTRRLTRDEQRSGWAAFWEARQAYPDGYCVVWVEVEDAGTWHDPGRGSACTAAAEPTSAPTPTADPAPAPTQPPQAAEPTRSPRPERPQATQAPVPAPPASPASTPTASPSPTPSPTPSATASASPSPSPATTPTAALLQGVPTQEPPPARTQAVAVQEDELITPLGWVGVLGAGALLAVGGLLLLWRRLT